MRYIIKDWAGNILNFKGRFNSPNFAVPIIFNHWDDAEDWLSINLKNYEEMRGEYYIEVQS